MDRMERPICKDGAFNTFSHHATDAVLKVVGACGKFRNRFQLIYQPRFDHPFHFPPALVMNLDLYPSCLDTYIRYNTINM